MRRKSINIFVYSAGVLLAITAIAKFVSSAGDNRVLQNPDPIMAIPFRNFFWFVGTIEFMVALVCFFGKRLELKIGLIAWLATSFLVYRLGSLLVGYRKPCPCMGNLTDALHIPEQTAETAMKIILAYLLIGSYAILFWLWRQNKKNNFVSPSA
jgi:hypothetical protein